MSDVNREDDGRVYRQIKARKKHTTWAGGRAGVPDFTPSVAAPQESSRVAEPKAKRGTGGDDQLPLDGPAGREGGGRDHGRREEVSLG